jgi:transcriptional regulator with XRE-family HTH domain
MADNTGIGGRVRGVRKRRGLTQRELAIAAGLSMSLVQKIEQGEYGDMRLETARKLAAALRVPTVAIMPHHDSPETTPGDTEETWEPVRHALAGHGEDTPGDDGPTLVSVREALDTAVGDVLDNRYADLRVVLPPLLRDADDLVGASVNGARSDARYVRSQSRQLAAYMLGQTRQFDAAEDAIRLAADDADDALTAMAAADWQSWILIRQGRLGDALALATRWADEAEPRVSRASADELAAWGRFQLRVTAAAMRDNRPDEAREALRMARVAAAGIGRDYIPEFNRWQVFGPATVSMFQAQNALIDEHPDTVLRIGERLEGQRFPLPETWNRHRLDIAQAHVMARQYQEAVRVLAEIRRTAPEWLAQQRYARDILGLIIDRRRTLTPEMRELADLVGLPL